MSCDELKKLLAEKGYYTNNLWQLQDVQTQYNCTEDEAFEVLDKALQNDATMSQIWVAIEFHAGELNLKPK